MHGRILGMDDVVNFEGADVDDYLALRGKLASR